MERGLEQDDEDIGELVDRRVEKHRGGGRATGGGKEVEEGRREQNNC